MNTTLTPDQLRQNAAAMLAFADGKPIQLRAKDTPEWMDFHPSNTPSWLFLEFDYRRKPEPATRPWSKPEDVPGPVCWITYDEQFTEYWLIMGFSPAGVYTRGAFYAWNELQEYSYGGHRDNPKRFFYSLDRKTWHPCTVTEGEQP